MDYQTVLIHIKNGITDDVHKLAAGHIEISGTDVVSEGEKSRDMSGSRTCTGRNGNVAWADIEDDDAS